MWDAFISHASEDKAGFAAPLADALNRLGVRVWFDEFTLRVGDSLSKSIDRGLAESRFGVLVLSKAFFGKPWPDYELRGLIAKEIGAEKVILPIWYDVSREDVVRFSPSLADKFAISAIGRDVVEVALQLLEVIRPDIFEQLHRRAEFEARVRKAPIVHARVDAIHPGPIAHETLPPGLLLRTKIVQRVLFEVMPEPLRATIDNFRRDVHPDRELEIWEAITASYLDAISGRTLSLDQRKEVFTALLLASMGARPDNPKYLSADDVDRLERIFRDVVPKVGEDDAYPRNW